MTNVLAGRGARPLRHIPRDNDSRPRVVASATYEIEDLRYSEDSTERPIGSGAATIGTVNTLLTAAAGPGEASTDRIRVTSAVGIEVGRPYLLSSPLGDDELVTIRAINGLDLYTHLELRHDYDATASLQSVEIVASFPALEADDELELEAGPHPYQVTWSYTIDAELYVIPVVVWLGRTTVAPLVTELDVLRAYPTIGARLRNRADISDAITTASEDYVAEVLAAGRDPEAFRANDTAKVAIRARALEYALRWVGGAAHDVNEAERFRAQFQYLMAQLLAGVPRPGVVTVNPATNVGNQDTLAQHPLFSRR